MEAGRRMNVGDQLEEQMGKGDADRAIKIKYKMKNCTG